MNYFQKKVATVITTSALLVNSVLPVLAQSTDLVITGNGADSNNDVNISQTSNTTVVQNNVADISNDVDATSNTGGNDQNYNTGGPVSLSTGDATTGVAVSNTANSNVADVQGCCAQDLSVEVSDNGYNSDNTVNTAVTHDTNVFQTNVANFNNDVEAKSNTGYNDQNYNTGGPVEMLTGDADTTVLLTNKANSNWARIGGGEESGSSVSLLIKGNGADSNNDINLAFTKSLSVLQENYADISNDVEAKSNTGKNDQNYNTGGPVALMTGDATTGVGIDNMANFNYADLDCGCLLDVFAKVGGNGYNSDNTINAALYDSKEAFQSNAYLCDEPWAESFIGKSNGCNDVEAKSDTGKNDQKYNTGANADPWTETGDAATLVDVSNTANANVLTTGGSDLPQLPNFDFNFDLGFNWLVWFGWLSGMNG